VQIGAEPASDGEKAMSTPPNGLRAAYIGEHWANDCRVAIRNGEIRGRHQGLSGDTLKEFVVTEFYPFPAASGLPFAAWLDAIAHHDFASFAPVEVVSLEPRRTDVVIRTGWYIRSWEGEATEQLTFETWMHRGFLFATMRHSATSPRHFRSALALRIAVETGGRSKRGK
jgi:hypothetical protein